MSCIPKYNTCVLRIQQIPFFTGLAMLDGFVYAVGGWEGSSRLDSVERYDPESNSWTSVSSLKMAVTSPAVVAHEGNINLHLPI